MTILNLPLPAGGEETRMRAIMTVEPGTGTIQSLLDSLTPREARPQGVMIVDTGTGTLPNLHHTKATRTQVTMIDGTGHGRLLSCLSSTPQVTIIAETGIETLLYPHGPTTHPGLITPRGMITICGLIALPYVRNWGLDPGRAGFGASSARSLLMQ